MQKMGRINDFNYLFGNIYLSLIFCILFNIGVWKIITCLFGILNN